MDLKKQVEAAQEAARTMAQLSTSTKNAALTQIAEAVKRNKKAILEANAIDLKKGEKKGLGPILDRLELNEERIEAIANETLKVVELKDYIGEVMEERKTESGFNLKRVRTPIGVIGMIYESRPNVTVDATSLCLKSSNAVILKGGSDAIHSNRVLVRIMQEAIAQAGMPFAAVQLVDPPSREAVNKMLKMKDDIDLIIPRGGKGLIDFVRENSVVPVIGTGAAVVHIYLDKEADLTKALPIVVNSKIRRVSICNSLDTLLVHKTQAKEFLPRLAKKLEKYKVEIRADQESFTILKNHYQNLKKAATADFDTEFLDYILAIKVVKSLNEALEHIEKHSLKHTEAIITDNKVTAGKFLKRVDAACVFHNMTTQYTDGAQFGLGAEIGISTQKLHVRGPFALEGLTSYKWIGEGDYSTRQ